MPTISPTICHVDDLEVDPALQASVAQAQVAVVIDVIRAFTTAAWALKAGARLVYLAPSLDQAVIAGARVEGAVLLKDGTADARFSLPNAPGRLARTDLTGQTVIAKTGNGTRGAHAVAHVPVILCAAFVTAAATARAVHGLVPNPGPGDVVIVTTEGDEDVALANYLVALLDPEVEAGAVDPAAYLARVQASESGSGVSGSRSRSGLARFRRRRSAALHGGRCVRRCASRRQGRGLAASRTVLTQRCGEDGEPGLLSWPPAMGLCHGPR